jgi:phosphatidylinositol alpha 1,6-mannosyltransferase
MHTAGHWGMSPRVAYFPDSFHEINGVAHTSRNFIAYAKRHQLPFLCVCAGEPSDMHSDAVSQHGEVQMLQLKRSNLAVRLESDLCFDLFFFRYSTLIEETLRKFKPDLIHITGPSELGLFGAYFAWKLNISLVASWHTNVHEYASRRVERFTQWLLGDSGEAVGRGIEESIFDTTALLYKQANVLYAPNPQLCSLLKQKTGRPCHLTPGGVDTNVFTPARRTRGMNDGRIVLGFVGRLSIEKNIALLPKVDTELHAQGIAVEWMIVGHGSEENMLRRQLSTANFAGVLRGDALAVAYANMDLLVFPSHTDTFGIVVLEALASGVPAIVTPGSGPATIVRDGDTGRVIEDAVFAGAVIDVLRDRKKHLLMREMARVHALSYSWDGVFDRVYMGYNDLPCLWKSDSER